MPDLKERKDKAKELRKAQNFKEAVLLYRDLWKETGDHYDGAGLLHCLRKLELFDEAIPLAEDLIIKHPESDWCRNEVIWTFISGDLYKLGENESVEKVVETAKKVMDLNPHGLAEKVVVFKVLKSAKAHGNWGIVNEWVIKIDPSALSTEPITFETGRKGWCDRSLWYNYKISGLLKSGGDKEAKEAIELVDEISGQFAYEQKFFLRLKALAFQKIGKLNAAEKIYEKLCDRGRPDWWMIHEKAKVVRDLGRTEDALELMYWAARSNRKLGTMVSLFADIGSLCKSMGKNEEARAHLVLCRYVREEKNWSLPGFILNDINELNEIIGNNKEPSSLKEALSICKSYWRSLVGETSELKGKIDDKRKIRKGLSGKVNFGNLANNFCFIITKDKESFFCFKKDLSSDIKDGDDISFDAIPSFDKKKNKKSWRATNIRHCT